MLLGEVPIADRQARPAITVRDSWSQLKGRALARVQLAQRLEHVLGGSTFGAFPIVGYFLEGRAGGDAAIRVAYVWVINPTAYDTFPFLH